MFKNIVSIINNFWSIKIFCFKFHFSKYFSGAEDGNYLNHTATGYCFSWSHNLSNLLLFFFLLIFFSFFFFLSLLLNLSPSLVYSSILRHVLYVSTAYIYLCNIHRWRTQLGSLYQSQSGWELIIFFLVTNLKFVSCFSRSYNLTWNLAEAIKTYFSPEV
jgi:hypothetical protein